MESNEISMEQVKVFRYVQQHAGGWHRTKDIAQGAGVAERTARHHASRLAALGILDQAEVFPGHRYRLADKAGKRNDGYLQRLEQACNVFGV